MPDLQIVQRFIEKASACRSDRDLHGLMDDATTSLGFDYFALVHHVDLKEHARRGAVALWTYPASWAAQYVERGLATSDPVHLASHRINIGFRWDDLPRLIMITAAHRTVRQDTLRAGIADGFTVPANIPGEANGSCSFAVRTGNPLPVASLPAAQLIGAFAFHAARRLVDRRARGDAVRPRLSPRQLECLIMVGQGASDRETAKRLGIAEDTVTEYLDEARHRYGVSRRTTLLLRAIFDGHIALSDVLREHTPP